MVICAASVMMSASFNKPITLRTWSVARRAVRKRSKRAWMAGVKRISPSVAMKLS